MSDVLCPSMWLVVLLQPKAGEGGRPATCYWQHPDVAYALHLALKAISPASTVRWLQTVSGNEKTGRRRSGSMDVMN